MRSAALVVVLVAIAGCGHARVNQVRFVNADPVWRVNDRAPFAPKPAERIYNRTLYQTDGFFVRRLTRWMDMDAPVRAADTNSLGEVPDSTWFTNRIGVRDLSIDEIVRGPTVDPSPFDHRPWTIKSAKVGGTSIGFVIEDQLGAKYLLKFDGKGAPDVETGAHIIGNRIMWAFGYNVPQDHVGTIAREDLLLAPDATKKDPVGHKTPLTAADVERGLSVVNVGEDGRMRVMVSRFAPGVPIGPAAREGRRGDDPNDKFPHERRRTLRGQYALFSWMNHSDIQEDQTIDVWIEADEETKRGYVMHYSLDWGKAFGVMGYLNHWQTPGYTYRLDLELALGALLTFGLVERPWERVRDPEIRGIGLWQAEYDPGAWRTNSPYWPFEDKDRFDAFWAAKTFIRFTREQLAAIVELAQFSDPRAAPYFLDVLIARQRRTARYWFERVAPLDAFTVVETAGAPRACFTDLTIAYELAPVATSTKYVVETFDYDGAPTAAARTIDAAATGTTCVDGIVPGTDHDSYTIVRVTVERGRRAMPPADLHLARAPGGALRVIGLWRE
jgi:hypothetical protein